MPKLLLALLAIIIVAPASASQVAAPTHKWACPYEQAKLAAAGYEPVDSSVDDPADGSLFDPGRRSALLP
jgi:hypothetical protein